MVLDIEDYLYHLEGLNLTLEEKEEIIRTVWGLMESVVDKAFGLHPVQLSCGYVSNDNLPKAVPIIESKKGLVPNRFKFATDNAAKERLHDGK